MASKVVMVDTTNDGVADSAMIALDTTGDGKLDTLMPMAAPVAPGVVTHTQMQNVTTNVTTNVTNVTNVVEAPWQPSMEREGSREDSMQPRVHKLGNADSPPVKTKDIQGLWLVQEGCCNIGLMCYVAKGPDRTQRCFGCLFLPIPFCPGNCPCCPTTFDRVDGNFFLQVQAGGEELREVEFSPDGSKMIAPSIQPKDLCPCDDSSSRLISC